MRKSLRSYTYPVETEVNQLKLVEFWVIQPHCCDLATFTSCQDVARRGRFMSPELARNGDANRSDDVKVPQFQDTTPSKSRSRACQVVSLGFLLEIESHIG